MKKIVMVFSVLMLLLPIVYAETKIFSGTVITSTDKVIEGGTFRFTYDETSNKAFVQTPSTGLIVDNGACKSNDVFKVCIDKANFSYKNITTYVYYYEITTTIYKLTGSLSATSKVTFDTLLQSESTDLTITITNPTNFDITNIIYKQDLTPFFIKEVKGCTLDGKQMTWQGSLKPNYDKICTATIVADEGGTYNLAGNLSYYNGFETENKTTDAITITVLPKQLKVSKLIDKDIEVKHPFYINMSLQNIHATEKIEAVETIELPSNIAILEDVPGFNKELNVLRRSFVLGHGSTLNYSLYLEASSEGNNPIKQKFDYTMGLVRNIIENNTFVNPLEPKPIINFSSEYTEVVPGQKYIVIAKLKNPSKVHELTEIKAKLDAPYSKEIEQSLNKLMPNESYQIISSTLIAPKETDLGVGDKAINLTLNIEYKFYGIAKSLNKSLELRIKQEAINMTTANITAIINETKINETKAENETKVNETVGAEPQAGNKTDMQVTTTLPKPKLKFDKESLFVGAFIFIVVWFILFIITKIRKRKKGNEAEEKMSKEPSESNKQTK